MRTTLTRMTVLGLLAGLLGGCSSSEEGNKNGGSDAGASGGADGGIPAEPTFTDWAQYGHDQSNSRANPGEHWINRDNVATLEVKWEFNETAVTSTPTLRDGTLYFGDWKAQVHAFDARSGEWNWTTGVLQPGGQNQVNHSVIVTEDTVYAGAHGAKLFALDRATGEHVWDGGVDFDTQQSLMLWSSPAIVDDTLIMGVGSYQVFIAGTTPFRGNVAAFDIGTGTEKWRTYMTDGSGVSVWSSPAIDVENGLVFIGTGQQYTADPPTDYSDALVAMNVDDGEIAWAAQFTEGDVFTAQNAAGPDHDVGSSPNLFDLDGVPYIGVGDKEGTYHVRNRQTGDQVWDTKLSPGGSTGGVMTSSAYFDGRIYVSSNDGSTGGSAGVGCGGPASSEMFALDAKTGKIEWRYALSSSSFGGLAYANGVVYTPTLDGVLYAFDAETGDVLWEEMVGDCMGGGVTVSGGMLFVGYGWSWLPLGAVAGGLKAYGLPE